MPPPPPAPAPGQNLKTSPNPISSSLLGSQKPIFTQPALPHPSSPTPNSQSSLESSLSCIGNLRPVFITSTDSNIHCLRFSESNDYLAVGLASGTTHVYHTNSNELLFTLKHEDVEVNVPVNCIAWRPIPENSELPEDSPARIKDIFLSGYSDGDIIFWHAPTGKQLTKLTETNNQVFTVEYSPDGSLFATGGSDCRIRIYTEAKKEIIQTLILGVDGQATGHSNRIFCIKWHPTKENILISSGWDSTIQIWDRSTGLSIRSIFGPHICGESLDFDASGKYILAGSHSIENSLSIHSLDVPQQDEKIRTSLSDEKRMTFLYSASFSPTKRFFYAGGGHGPGITNEFKMFLSHTKLCVGHVFNFPGPLFSCSVTKDDKKLAIGGAFPYLILFAVETTNFPEILY